MLPRAWLGERVRVAVRLDQIFDDKSRATHSADDVSPGMEILNRVRLAMPARQDRRQWPDAISGFDDHIPARRGQRFGLQARGLFVLANVNAALTRDARDFAKDRENIRDVACADRLQ